MRLYGYSEADSRFTKRRGLRLYAAANIQFDMRTPAKEEGRFSVPGTALPITKYKEYLARPEYPISASIRVTPNVLNLRNQYSVSVRTTDGEGTR